MLHQCPLSGVKRTWPEAARMSPPSSNPDFSAHDRVRSCKEWMRRSLLAFPLHHVDAGADFGVGHVQAELITQHRPELSFVAQVPPFCIARRVPNRHTRIEHGDPCSIGARTSSDDVAPIRSVWMRTGIPVCDLVFAIVAGVWDHTVDVLPAVA